MNSAPLDASPDLPQLDAGVTLLDAEERATGALQSLVLDRVLLDGGAAAWVDSKGHARTVRLGGVAPSARVLDRIRVARAFTAFQHYSLVDALRAQVTPATSVVVVPEVDWFYRADDLHRGEGAAMLERALAALDRLSDRLDVPVLLTRSAATGVGELVDAVVDRRVACEVTPMGPRFSAPDFETLVYPGNGYVQTTLAFWQRVLESRHPTAFDAGLPEVGRGTN